MEDSEGPATLLVSWSPELHMSIPLPNALSISKATTRLAHILLGEPPPYYMEATITQPLPPAGIEGAWLSQSQTT